MRFPTWSAENWADALWKHFLPQIQSGRPVYFSIDRSLLQELVIQRELSRMGDPILHLAKSCNELIEHRGRRVALRLSATYRNATGVSNIICLIALQVVAVELMTGDEEFSEDAYFPRLRELLGILDDAYPFSNPFYQDQFQVIWEKFKSEILAQPGGSVQSITFHKGKGRNLHRELPFSQALLGAALLKRRVPALLIRTLIRIA